MKNILLLSLLFFNGVLSFLPQFPKVLDNKKLQTFEPFYEDEESKTVVLHTAVFNKIPNYIYSDLINKLNDENIKVVIPSVSSKKSLKSLDDNLTVLGHSSGSITALELAKNKKVKNLVLIDPIDNRFINSEDDEDEEEYINLENIENALFIYTKKSYDWSLFPFSLPFIPDNLSLKPKNIKISNEDNKCVIDVKRYGHCDILDQRWADLAHNTICKGVENRNEVSKYHKWLSFAVKCVAFDTIDNLTEKKNNFSYFKFRKQQKKSKEECPNECDKDCSHDCSKDCDHEKCKTEDN